VPTSTSGRTAWFALVTALLRGPLRASRAFADPATREAVPADEGVSVDSAPLRAHVGTALVLVFALSTSARWVQKVVHAGDRLRAPDEASEYDRRLAPLRERLPRDAVVGYLSDPLPATVSMAEGRLHYKKYLLTRYALAPVLVIRNQQPTLIVGNFNDPSSVEQAARLGLERLEDFGEGIVLFRRRAE
jgi:hypothetical protein